MTAFGFKVVSWKSRHSGFSTNDPTLILYIPWCCHAKIIIWTIKLPETTFTAISIIMHCKMTLIEGDFGKGGGGYPIPQHRKKKYCVENRQTTDIPWRSIFNHILCSRHFISTVLTLWYLYRMLFTDLHYVIRYDAALTIQGLLYLQCCTKTT